MKKKLLTLLSLLMILVMSFTLAACGGGKGDGKVGEEIENGGFEAGVGSLAGWTASGNAFGQYGVINGEKVNDVVVGKVGNNFFSGLSAGMAAFTGTLTGKPFKLAGTGKIAYRIGAGENTDKCYIEFIEKSSGTVLLKKGNDDFSAPYITDHLVPNIVDLSAHIGKTLVIKITDDDRDRNGYSYLNLDDFKVLKTEAEVTAAVAEREAVLAEIGAPTFEEDPSETTIRNGDFEDGLTNWLVVEGNAFSKKTISLSTETFHDAGRKYYAHGNKFLNGYNVPEANTGVLRSGKFTLKGDGYISLLIGGGKTDKNYVAVCDGETDEELMKVDCADHFKDPGRSMHLIRKFIDAGEYIDKVLYIKIVDGDSRQNDYAAITVDDVRVSMTEEAVKELVNETYNWAQNLDDAVDGDDLREYYGDTSSYPFNPEILIVDNAAVSDAIVANNAVDVTKYIKDVTGAFGEVDPSEITAQIDKVVYNDTAVTENFTAVDMSRPGIYTVHYSLHYGDYAADATFLIVVSGDGEILNGDFETGNLSGWTVSEGNVNLKEAVSGKEFGWTGASYNHAGKYHLDGTGCAPESETYALRSSEFTLGGSGVISFRMGGRAATLRVYEKISGVCLAEYKNTQWNDDNNPHVESGCRNLTMTAYYADLSTFVGSTLYIELADTETSGWGVAHFDEIITYYPGEKAEVLATLAEKKDTVNYKCEETPGTTEIAWAEAENNVSPELLSITRKIGTKLETAGAKDINEYLAEAEGAVVGIASPQINKSIVKVNDGTSDITSGFGAFELTVGKIYTVTYKLSFTPEVGDELTVTDTFKIKAYATQYELKNGDFETGDMAGWSVISGRFNTETALSNNPYTGFGKMPVNNNGWYVDGWNGACSEGDVFAIRSTVFTLGGSGRISFKMGGRTAEVHVFKKDGTQIAKFTNTQFADRDFPHVENGARQATMTTYVADLSAYMGEELYIELVDSGTSAWGLALFDDIITYYETAPDMATAKDTVKCYANESDAEPTIDYDIAWVEARNEYSAPQA